MNLSITFRKITGGLSRKWRNGKKSSLAKFLRWNLPPAQHHRTSLHPKVSGQGVYTSDLGEFTLHSRSQPHALPLSEHATLCTVDLELASHSLTAELVALQSALLAGPAAERWQLPTRTFTVFSASLFARLQDKLW